MTDLNKVAEAEEKRRLRRMLKEAQKYMGTGTRNDHEATDRVKRSRDYEDIKKGLEEAFRLEGE